MFRLNLFGGASLADSDGQAVESVLSQPKRLALLSYLTLAPPGTFRTRDTVLGLFWPESTETAARGALNQSLHFLRRLLGPEAIVSRGPGDIGVQHATISCDVIEFERLIDSHDTARALSLYGGDLLVGFHADAGPEFDQWLRKERARLSRMASVAAWQLADSAEKGGQIITAIDWARKGLELSQNDESSARGLIELLDRAGDRVSALQAYQDFAKQLADEYAAQPSLVTQALIARIQSPDARPSFGAAPHAIVNEQLAAPVSGPAAPLAEQPDSEARDHSEPPQVEVVAVPSSGSHPYRWTTATALCILTVVVLLVWRGIPRVASNRGQAAREPVVIVMPLAVTGSSSASTQLASLLTTALIHQLVRVRSVDVRNGLVGDAPLRVPPDAVAPAVVVAGSVLGTGNSVRLNLQVTDVVSGRIINSATLDRERYQPLPLADTIAHRIASLVLVGVAREMRLRAQAASTSNPRILALVRQADEQADRATQLAQEGEPTAALSELWNSDSSLDYAMDDAPRNMGILLQRARILNRLTATLLDAPFSNRAAAQSVSAREIAVARRALAINPSDAAAIEASGSAWYSYWRSMPLTSDSADRVRNRAEQQLRRAVKLDPRRTYGWSRLSSLFLSRNDRVDTYRAAARAYDSDVFMEDAGANARELFLIAYEMGNDSLATSWCDSLSVNQDQASDGAHCRLELLAWAGVGTTKSISQAWAIAASASGAPARNRPIQPSLDMLVAAVIARHGARDSARSIINRTRARDPHPQLGLFEADARVQLGDLDSATALVARYVAGAPRARMWLAHSRRFAELKQLPTRLAHVTTPSPGPAPATASTHRARPPA